MIESAEEFVRLRSSSDPMEYLRAANESAAESVWHEVISRYPDYKKWVAHNKSVPQSILQLLAFDESPDIRLCVAMKNSAGDDLLAVLAEDGDANVRQRVAYNKNTSTSLLERLSADSSEIVAQVATERLNKRVCS